MKAFFSWLINPFAPEPPVRMHVPSTACIDISVNGQGQLCPLTCAEWRDLSNHTTMSTIQSRAPKKKATNQVTLTWEFPWKSCSTTHLPLLSCNSKILKACLKSFPLKWRLLNAQQKKKNEARKRKVKVKTAVWLLNPNPHARTSQANILHPDQKAAKCTTFKWVYGEC